MSSCKTGGFTDINRLNVASIFVFGVANPTFLLTLYANLEKRRACPHNISHYSFIIYIYLKKKKYNINFLGVTNLQPPQNK